MRIERSSVDQVKSRFDVVKKKLDEKKKEYDIELKMKEMREEVCCLLHVATEKTCRSFIWDYVDLVFNQLFQICRYGKMKEIIERHEYQAESKIYCIRI